MKTIKRLAALLALLLLAAAAVSCGKTDEGTLALVREKSSFSDYEVRDDRVTIYCEITVRNTYDRAQYFTLSADFPDDEGVLLKERTLYGADGDTGREVLEIDAGEEKTFTVLFIGNYGGTNVKHDRELPPITIRPTKFSK